MPSDDIKEIEVPHPFTAVCESCGSCESEDERLKRIEYCKISATAYQEGYKAAMRKCERQKNGNKYLTTRVTTFCPETQTDKTFMFVGLFDIDKGTVFNLDTGNGLYGQQLKMRLIPDGTMREELKNCFLRKLEIRIADTLVEGNGGSIKIEGYKAR